MAIRKWMELWIDLQEKDVLNLMRWMKGGTEEHMHNCYVNGVVGDVMCACRCEATEAINLKSQPDKSKNSTVILNY
jgi:hypothetical protein